MTHSPFFLAIEGLDGSGKTTLAKQLALFLEFALQRPTLFTYQPHDDSCGGDYIRQVLTKQITVFTPEALLYGFAANRQDHGARVITPWLTERQGIVVCDRYYLS
ncbi:MAG: thymidylate kinase, partial [Bacteroidota bacterium]